MADTIGSLAYRLRLDSTQFVAGMVATRAEFAAAKRIASEVTPTVDRYAQAMSNLDVLLKKGLITQNQHEQMQKRIQREYLESEAKVRRLTAAEKARLDTLRQTSQGLKTTADDEARRNRIMERGREITEQTRSTQDRMNRSLAEARRLYREGAISAQTYARHVANIRGPGMIGQLGGMLNSGLVKGAGAIGAAIGGTAIVGKAIGTHAEIERMSASMEVFTGSASKAKATMDDIRKLSSISGISFNAIAEGATAMMSYGVSTEETNKKLVQFAAISRGDPERFRSLALAFGQVNAAGRLMGQEVLQMVNAGFNPLQEISRTTGIEFKTLKKMMEEGNVSIEMVAKSFETATSSGGRFDGMLEKIGQTSSGSIGKMKAEWSQFLDTFGKSLPAKAGADAITTMLRGATTWWSDFETQVKQRSESAKAAGANSWSSISLGGTRFGRTDLSIAAQRNNAIDIEIKRKHGERLAEAEKERMANVEKQKAQLKADEDLKKKELELQKGMADKLHELKMDSYKDLLPKEQNDKLQRTLDLLDDITKKKAELDYMKNKDIDALGAKFLDEQTRKQLDALNKEFAAKEAQQRFKKREEAEKKQQQKLEQEANDVKARARMRDAGLTDQQMGFVEETAKLKMLLDKKLIDEKTFNSERNRLAGSSVSNQSVESPSMAAKGSQEAYRIITAAMNRSDEKTFKENQKQTLILKTIKETNQRAEELLKELNDKLDFELVGG